MKVIGGLYKNRSLKSPKGLNTRPTTGQVREAVFNLLMPEIQEAIFLDAFAGSGAMGIEALSRGASFCTFIDSSLQAKEALESNLNNLNIPKNQYHILKKDVLKALSKTQSFGLTNIYDIIYVDPPFKR